ncbi:MAG: type II toxin-antitoxin system VapC family toxin [Deltaproteobacteria bacterium]|nr:type II toxin-antitoxin system VapC family toxin [Deltaproteobacteria bacterium]
MFYLDTSVLVAYYCPESISEMVEEFFLKIKQPAISQLTELELVSAISRKIREKNLTIEDGNKIIAQFQSHFEKKLFKMIQVQSEHYQMARNWISQFSTPLRTLDALHLAVASLNNLTVLSADYHMAKSAQYFGVDVKYFPNP